jgi:hypothetical protein
MYTNYSLWAWFVQLLSLRPHQVIALDLSQPYLLRWYLLPRNRFFNLYLHKFLRDDEDRALHDHPWWFVSLMLWGSYYETRATVLEPDIHAVTKRSAPSICYRNVLCRHRVTLCKDSAGKPTPCWTIVLTGPKVKSWGFWCPKGWIHWKEFENQGGCGED